MSCHARKRTFGQMHPGRFRLDSRSLIEIFTGRILKKVKEAKFLYADNDEDQSDCADAQADLSFRWPHMSEGTFS